MDDDTKDSSATNIEVKTTKTDTPTSTIASEEPVSDSDAAKVDETLSAPPEVEVDSAGKLSGASAVDNIKTEFKPPPSDDLKSDDSTNNPVAISSQTGKKKSSIVITIAIVIFILLVVAAYFAYKNNQKNTTSKAAKTATVATTSQAKASDIDQTDQAIDKDLSSINDDKDFSSIDLSDTTLGL